jgi:hypothetical protein
MKVADFFDTSISFIDHLNLIMFARYYYDPKMLLAFVMRVFHTTSIASRKGERIIPQWLTDCL